MFIHVLGGIRMTTEKLFYKIGEASRVLSMGRTRLYQFIASGELPSIKLGTSRLIAVADLEAFAVRLRGRADDVTERPCGG
jgi:excisionase family DNA binding protein